MSRNRKLKELRNKEVVKSYKKLENEKTGKVQTYRHTAILDILSKEFFLSPRTIQDIVSKEG